MATQDLRTLQSEYKAAQSKARTLHAKWASAHRGDNWPLRHSTYAAWQNELALAARIAKLIQREQAFLKKPATTASMSLALAAASFEGGRGPDGLFHPYRDPVGVWTIGYGHTASAGAPFPASFTKPLTGVEATALLLHDLNHIYAPPVAAVCKRDGLKQNQKQFDALVDFAYNLGPGYFTTQHDVGMALAARDWNRVANYILAYDHAGGQVLAGLRRRREWESNLIRGGTYAV